jgi:hypothetical protein
MIPTPGECEAKAAQKAETPPQKVTPTPADHRSATVAATAATAAIMALGMVEMAAKRVLPE